MLNSPVLGSRTRVFLQGNGAVAVKPYLVGAGAGRNPLKSAQRSQFHEAGLFRAGTCKINL